MKPRDARFPVALVSCLKQLLGPSLEAALEADPETAAKAPTPRVKIHELIPPSRRSHRALLHLGG